MLNRAEDQRDWKNFWERERIKQEAGVDGWGGRMEGGEANL